MSSSLLDKIQNQTVHIALLIPSQPVRIAMIKTLHKMGFQNLVLCKTPGDLLKKMRSERVDWVISALLDDQPYTMLDLLKVFYNDLLHQNARISLILGEKQLSILPQACSAGLLSWFPLDKCTDPKSVEQQITEFFGILTEAQESSRHEAYIAANYLRRYLRNYMIWGELIALEQALCDAFPLHVENLIGLAEAYFLSGDYSKGRLIVSQAQQISSESLDHHIEALLQKFPKSLIKKQGTLAERFDIQNVIMVERDDSELNILRSAMKRIGVQTFQVLSSFEEAWQNVKARKEPDLIICEWSKRQGDLSTVQFLQRVRGHGFLSVPVMVAISQLRPQDSQILHDVGTLQLLQKPLREDHVVMALAFAIQQARQPTERKPVEQKIVQCLLGGYKPYAYQLRKLYHADKAIVPSRKYYIEALFHYHHGNFTKARNHLIKGIKLSLQEKGEPDEVRPNLDKTVLLAKCLYRLGDKALAIQMLEKARRRSPYNISILLALTEMNYDVGNISEAQEAIEEAENIDAGNAQVIQTGARFYLLSGRVDKASQFLRKMESKSDIITRMNNQAVSFIQSGEFQRGVSLYESALEALPQEESDLMGVVYYNLALAFLRNDQLEQGIVHLESSTSFTSSRVHGRASSLRKRIEESKQTGRRLKFTQSQPVPTQKETEKLAGFFDALVAIRQTGVALQHIYRQQHDERVEDPVEDTDQSPEAASPQTPSGKRDAS